MFAIVEFTEAKEVAIVPKCWIVTPNLCVWPPLQGSAILEATKKCQPPAKNWGMFEVRILKEYGKTCATIFYHCLSELLLA